MTHSLECGGRAAAIRRRHGRRTPHHGLHGFLVSIVNGVWVTAAHVLLYDQYIARHAREGAMIAESPMAQHPRLMMAITGPIVGILSGLVLGLFAWIASKLTRSRAASPAT